MKLTFSKADEQFRAEIAAWLKANLVGDFEQLKFRGGPATNTCFRMKENSGNKNSPKAVGLAWAGQQSTVVAAHPSNSK